METINTATAKRGDIVKFNNGCIGIYEFSYSYQGSDDIYVMCSACCHAIGNNIQSPKVLFHTPVFSNNYTVITNSDDKEFIAFMNVLMEEYTETEPEWDQYLTDSTYFEIKDWLKSKIMVEGVDIDKDDDVINDNVDITIGNIAYYIYSHTSDNDKFQTVSYEESSILDKLAKTAYEYELDSKHISTSTDVLEMHDDTCHYLSAKLSNIRHGSEVMKSTSSPFTQTQEALFEMVWACLAELNKRNVNIEELVDWKLDKIS